MQTMKVTDTQQVILHELFLNMKCHLVVNNASSWFYKQCFGNTIISNYAKVKINVKPLKIRIRNE